MFVIGPRAPVVHCRKSRESGGREHATGIDEGEDVGFSGAVDVGRCDREHDSQENVSLGGVDRDRCRFDSCLLRAAQAAGSLE